MNRRAIIFALLACMSHACGKSPGASAPSAAPASPAEAPVAAPAAPPTAPEAPATAPAEQPAEARPAPEGPRPLLLVLDGSGSMRGRVGGKPKMRIARDVLHGLVDALPDGTEAGLFAYGHRDEERCDDIEQLVDLSPIDRGAFNEAIDRVEPRGKTPLTAATRQAIDLARQRELAATVVLVSDGLETCDADPCAMVKEAKAAGVSFVLHVVGFDLKGQDTAALRCAAEQGGGRYLEANDAEQLSAALDLAAAESKPPTGTLIVKTEDNGKPLQAHVLVRRAGEERWVANQHAHASGGGPATFLLPEGSYELEARPRVASKRSGHASGVAVVAGETTERVIAFGSGRVELRVTHNGEPFDPLVRIFAPDQKRAILTRFDKALVARGVYASELAAGSYRVELVHKKLLGGRVHELQIEVEPGKTTEAAHDFQSGLLGLSIRSGGAPASGVAILKRDGELVKPVTVPAGEEPHRVQVEPGAYEIRASNRGGKATKTVTVEAGKTHDVEIDL